MCNQWLVCLSWRVWGDVVAAIPMRVAYFAGSWVGAALFKHATERSYRRYALGILIFLALAGLVQQIVISG